MRRHQNPPQEIKVKLDMNVCVSLSSFTSSYFTVLARGGTLERSQSRTRSPAYNDVPAAPSKLVLELGENFQEKKYYYIPDYIEDQLKATKIMKRGKKLHLCNDHSFVAVKTKGNVFCDVCNGKIATNFVKQAYQCRGKLTVQLLF